MNKSDAKLIVGLITQYMLVSGFGEPYYSVRAIVFMIIGLVSVHIWDKTKPKTTEE